ncbi:hypothetical protein HYPDE_30768 [Hyphomicrobium denitrificans 1NES1]|uniref:Uncharacterized protein n=1 Tax=Hyphomicrobium denitrificans 1NES1 TaxID=670307 RepID=N0B491_9HYPH|nr:hypothetical protein HYPDE_30768 [Hyphomicrobium denitrificans 1NES1]
MSACIRDKIASAFAQFAKRADVIKVGRRSGKPAEGRTARQLSWGVHIVRFSFGMAFQKRRLDL